MKKLFVLGMLLTLTAFLFACNGDKTKDTSSKVIISKYYDALDMKDNAIELYNTGDKEIDLSSYRIDIYPNGDSYPEYKIELSGKIAAKGYYVIAREASETVVENADLNTSQLLYNGNDMVALTRKDKILDVVGYYQSNTDFGKDATLIRKPDSMVARNKYNEGDFIIYQANVFEYLKNDNFPVKTREQLLAGPKFDSALLDLPFLDPEDPTGTIGGGGAIEARLISIADGDTASFDVRMKGPDSPVQTIRVRYLYIDTPEVAGPNTGNGNPWGRQASNFNKQYLLHSSNIIDKKIYLQSVKGLSTVDTYGRVLALVWIGEDLSNHVIALNGLSGVDPDFTAGSMSAAYMQVPYFSYMIQAESNAMAKKLGVHGAIDECWDYELNLPTTGTCAAYPKDTEWK